MNISIERSNKRAETAALSKEWQREDLLKKTALSNNSKVDVYFISRNGLRTDISLVPPIRQTASIFKQPVTIHKTQDSKTKTDLKYGIQEKPKPKQLFWEKRLEGLKACDSGGNEFTFVELNKGLKPVGPNVNETTLLQSIATSLHIGAHSVIGQTAAKTALSSNPGVFLNVDQPLMYSYSISEDDIKRQEERVNCARKKLQEALKT